MLTDKIKALFKNNTVKNGIIFTIYSFINSGFSFILLLILAKYISPAEYGKLNLFTIFTQILTIFISLGTQGYVAIVFFRGREGLYKSILSIVFIISTLMFLFYVGVLLIAPKILEETLGLDIKYLFAATIVCYFQVFNTQCLEMLRINEYIGKYGIFSVSQALLNFLLSLLLVVTLQYGWVGRVFTSVLLSALYFIISLCYFYRNRLFVTHISEKGLYNESLKYGIPLLPHHTAVWVRQSFDRFVINSYYASSLVGLYSFASNFANILLMVGTAFNAVNSVQIYKQLSHGYSSSKKNLDDIIHYTSLAFFLLTISIIAGCYMLIPLLFPEYVSSTKYLIPLMISTFFQCIYLLNVNYLFFYKKTLILMYITVSMSIVQLILSMVFTKYNVMYTACINMMVNGLICLFVLLYKRMLCKKELKRELGT